MHNFFLSLGPKWVHIASYLGFTPQEIADISSAHPESIELQVHVGSTYMYVHVGTYMYMYVHVNVDCIPPKVRSTTLSRSWAPITFRKINFADWHSVSIVRARNMR